MRTYESVLFSVGAGLLVACGSSGDDRRESTDSTASSRPVSSATAGAQGVSMVRFVNAVRGPDPLSVTSDSVTVFIAIWFGNVTPYRDLAGNLKTFSLAAPGVGRALATSTESMRDGGRYTIMALPDRHGDATLRAFRDEFPPAPGMARIRVIHAAPELDDLDIMISGQPAPLFDVLDYKPTAEFRDVTASDVVFTMRQGSRPVAVSNLWPVHLTAGSEYTIVLIGLGGGKAQAISFTDVPETARLQVSARDR